MTADSYIILCGQISVYNKDVPYPPPLPVETERTLEEKNITRDRFLVLNYVDKFAKAVEILCGWYRKGQIKVYKFWIRAQFHKTFKLQNLLYAQKYIAQQK